MKFAPQNKNKVLILVFISMTLFSPFTINAYQLIPINNEQQLQGTVINIPTLVNMKNQNRLFKSQIASIDISTYETPGYAFIGETEGDSLGIYISGVGDVNNDGYDDIIIGAPGAENQAGKAYLILGRSDILWTEFDLSQVNASFIGENAWDWAGRWVSGVGDVNGDGYEDFAISAMYNDEGGTDAGQTYLFFGGPNRKWKINTPLSQANVSFIGETSGDQSGHGVFGIGDTNNDGFDDFLISGMYNDEGGTDAGQIYLFFGRPTNHWTISLSLTQANASYIGNGVGNTLGLDAAGVGDVNNDNFSDFVIGAWVTENSIKIRKLYLILGGHTNQWTMDQSVSQINASFFNDKDTNLASMFFSLDWISSAGDVNNDNYDDILFGVYEDDEGGNNAGQTYLFLGQPTDFWTKNLSFSQANVSLIGQLTDGWSGSSVAGVGDVNNDGYDDFVIGSPGRYTIENASFSGQAHLILGKPLYQGALDVSLAKANVSFSGQSQGDGFGFHVSGVGDVNNDGFHDFAISAPYSTNKAGKVYLILHPFNNWTWPITSATTTTTMTKAKAGTFPSLLSVLGIFGIIVVFDKKQRKM